MAKTSQTKPAKKKYKYTKKPGRPPASLDQLPADWKEQILTMASNGYSEVEIRAELCLIGKPKSKKRRFSHNIWYAIKAREQEFAETIKTAKLLAEAWWVKLAREKLYHSSFQKFETATWFINMKNRFGWSDKSTVELDVPEGFFDKYRGMSDAELNRRYAELSTRNN